MEKPLGGDGLTARENKLFSLLTNPAPLEAPPASRTCGGSSAALGDIVTAGGHCHRTVPLPSPLSGCHSPPEPL